MNVTDLPHVATEVITICQKADMSYGEAMAFLIQVAEMAAEMEHAFTKKDQEPHFINACNFALKEYRKRLSNTALADGKFVHAAPKGTN